MRLNQIHSNDGQYKGKPKEKRRKFISDEFEQFTSKQDIYLRKTQKKYKIAKREAGKQIKDWEKAYS
jgi:uncharacterized protein YjbJ (UPF0337 family)